MTGDRSLDVSLRQAVPDRSRGRETPYGNGAFLIGWRDGRRLNGRIEKSPVQVDRSRRLDV